MFWWLYEILFWILLIISSPFYLKRMIRRGGYARGFFERFGLYTPELKDWLRHHEPIWIHGVSVGEMQLALHFISQLTVKYPHLNILLSTTTSTGHALASKNLTDRIRLIYYPLDSFFCFSRIHSLTHIKALVLMEAELWPYHLHSCSQRGIPLLLLNARISNRSFPRYRSFRFLFAPVFQSFSYVSTQSHQDHEKLCALGFRQEALQETGSMKFDVTLQIDTQKLEAFQKELSALQHHPLLVGGSTHPGEEEILIQIYQRLKKTIPDLVLILTPRHVERTPEIEQILKKSAVPYRLKTQLARDNDHPDQVVILNTTGELKYLYALATVIFVGKSLCGHGGQNIIEPAAFAKPIIFGPHMENFEGIQADFLEHQAAIQIRDACELESVLDRLFHHPDERASLGRRARNLVEKRTGATQAALSQIGQLITTN